MTRKEAVVLVTEILKTKGDLVFTVGPDESIQSAAEQLLERRVGAVVVLDGESVVGILSERDVVQVVAREGAGALANAVSCCMTRDVHTARPNESVDQLLARMTDRRIRHLPVVHDGRLCGIVSIGDLVKSKIEEVEAESQGLRQYIAAG